MTMQSLQTIIRIENELHAHEQAERKKITQWLKDTEAEIHAEYQAKRDELASRQEEAKKQTRKESEKKAAAIIRNAGNRAFLLAEIDDNTLSRYLQKQLTSILSGNIP